MVVCLTDAKINPFIFSVSGFPFSDVANICIFMILYDLCLLPAHFRYVIINIRHLESHVQLADRCALYKCTKGAENLASQALQFRKVGICSKFRGGTRISHYDRISALRRVSLMLMLNRSLLNRIYTLINVLKTLASIISVFNLLVILFSKITPRCFT
jgi:hypothetical protein